MKKRWTTFAIVTVTVLAVVAAGSVLLAQEREQRRERVHRAEHMMTRLAAALELTDEQSAALSAIMEEQMAGGVEQRDAVNDARRLLHTVVSDPEADEQQVIDAVRTVSAEMERMALEQHRLTIRISEVLTPEQMDQFQELIPRRMERFDGRGHRHGRFGDGT
ncbi:MAG: periplasmic heavy metal sensor [Acidobacteriota bacterium]|nr:periplasmic heavy metal sensor [Acidobacteriota bacterium]